MNAEHRRAAPKRKRRRREALPNNKQRKEKALVNANDEARKQTNHGARTRIHTDAHRRTQRQQQR